MKTSMKLPISVTGALMSDAHQGMVCPLKVFWIANAIIPLAVGADVACLHEHSIFDLPALMIEKEDKLLKKILTDNTIFGIGSE